MKSNSFSNAPWQAFAMAGIDSFLEIMEDDK